MKNTASGEANFELTKKTTAARIQAVFESHAEPVSTRELAKLCLEQGVFDDIQLENMRIKAAQIVCESALRANDDKGLPYAMALSTGRAAPWKQRELFDIPDYVTVIDIRIRGVKDDLAVAKLLQQECQQRFGTAPSVPELAY